MERSVAFGCTREMAGIEPAPPPDDPRAPLGEPQMAGQMTEEAAQGRRLFNAERWADAAKIFERVVNGDTGDDTGNKQIAEYNLAICEYRLKHLRESLEWFGAIARNPSHLKWAETLLWLVRIARLGPPFLDPAGRLVTLHYPQDDVARFDNPQQREIAWFARFVVGRELYREGEYARALDALSRVPPQSDYHEQAMECAGLARRMPAGQKF